MHAVADSLFNGLVALDATLSPVPDLATRWTISPDGKSYTFDLAEAKWHDGQPFTSADVKYTFEEILLKYHARTKAGLASVIEGIDVPNDRQIVFRLKAPHGAFLRRLDVTEAPILPKHLFAMAGDPNNAPANLKPIGTGPFKLTKYQKDESVTLQRNPDYFKQDLPKLDRLVLRIIKEPSTALLAFQRGEVDYFPSVPANDISRLKANGNAKFITASSVADAEGAIALGNSPRSRLVGLWCGLLLLAPILISALVPWLIAPNDPFANVGPALQAPSLSYPLGTDDLGRDLFSGVIFGARMSLLIGGGAALLSLTIGIFVGVVAGYVGGWTDDLLMRGTEIVMLLPRFFVALLVVTLFGSSILNIGLVLGLLGWPSIARAEALAQTTREYVMAAAALGASRWRIMLRHILPAVQPIILSIAAPTVTAAILTEAGLAFLGLADPNWISWGKIIQNGQTFYYHGWWLSLFPGLAIVWTCVGIALFIEGLDERPSA